MTTFTDDDLDTLLGTAAAAAPPPWAGPPDLFDDEAVRRREPAKGHRPPPLWLAIAAAVVAALLGGSLVLDQSSTQPAGDQPAGAAAAPDGEQCTAPRDATGGAQGGGLADDGTAANAATIADESTGSAQLSTGTGASLAGGEPAGLDGARIARDGSVEVEVAPGGFEATVARVTGLATGLGGYVSATRTTESGEAPSGTVTVRVPVGAFDDLLAQVRRLGEVRSVATTGTDVTAQYTDLEARLGALAATRDQLLTILGEAQAIPDILAVQDRLNAVQLEIESLEGQRRVLADQSDLASLAVTLLEPGAEEAAAVVEQGDGGLGGAWEDARRSFGDALEWIVARTGGGLVVALAGLAALAGGRLVLLRLRRSTI